MMLMSPATNVVVASTKAAVQVLLLLMLSQSAVFRQR